MTSDLETANIRPGSGVEKLAFFALKLAVSGGCFWYVLRQVDTAEVARIVPTVDFRWAAFAALVVALQIPLVALRWREILGALAVQSARITRPAVIAVTAIGTFFAQFLPNVVGDGMRVWLIARLGCDWRNTVASVVIDRGVGVALLLAFGLVILLLPSALSVLGGYRDLILVIYAAALLGGIVGLILTPVIAPLLERWRYSRWAGTLARAARHVLFGPRAPAILAFGCLVHVFTIIVVWSAARAQGLALPVADAAVLFTVVVGVALVPISVGGWGLRELAVTALLGGHGVPPEKALLFSIGFGLVLLVGALPGVFVWLLYPIPPQS